MWFVARALVTTFNLGKAVGPDFSLRVARIVPDTSALFQLARAGNIPGIEYLFNNGLASPFDVGGTLGATALHVSFFAS